MLKVLHYFLQVLSCISHILQTDKEPKVRQAALVVLKLLVKGLSQDSLQVQEENNRRAEKQSDFNVESPQFQKSYFKSCYSPVLF